MDRLRVALDNSLVGTECLVRATGRLGGNIGRLQPKRLTGNQDMPGVVCVPTGVPFALTDIQYVPTETFSPRPHHQTPGRKEKVPEASAKPIGKSLSIQPFNSITKEINMPKSNFIPRTDHDFLVWMELSSPI